MKPPQQLHDLGQSLWLDTITRDLLTSGTLKHYIDALSLTGLKHKGLRHSLQIRPSPPTQTVWSELAHVLCKALRQILPMMVTAVMLTSYP